MSEKLLHFIWQFQYFNRSELRTTKGEPVQVLYPGLYNSNQGPDFTAARIRIGDTIWAGTVELHIKTSDWSKHQHGQDPNYRNVILHVAWEQDTVTNSIPVIELRSRVPGLLMQRYKYLMQAPQTIACGSLLNAVSALTWQSWKDRLVAERMYRKSAVITQSLQQNNYHWEETCWWMLARNFGMKVNADAFEAVARSIAFNILRRHCNRPLQLEALLFGQAGLLETIFLDEYPRQLQAEYRFLQKKFKLQPIHHPIHFLRMRPVNFPSIRLAQLASLQQQPSNLFSRIRELENIQDLRNIFLLTASEYWDTHYRFDEPAHYQPKKTGAAMVDSILVNTVIPLLFAYGNYYREERFKEKALAWLEKIPSEKNSVTDHYTRLGLSNKNACDSQAFIELHAQYCSSLKCLECAVGNAILKQGGRG